MLIRGVETTNQDEFDLGDPSVYNVFTVPYMQHREIHMQGGDVFRCSLCYFA